MSRSQLAPPLEGPGVRQEDCMMNSLHRVDPCPSLDGLEGCPSEDDDGEEIRPSSVDLYARFFGEES